MCNISRILTNFKTESHEISNCDALYQSLLICYYRHFWKFCRKKMNESPNKRPSFMIADLLSNSNAAPSERKFLLPAEVSSSNSATGCDVIANDVVDFSVQSPTHITPRGRTQDNPRVVHETNHRLNFAAENIPPSYPSVVKPAPCPSGLLRHRISSSSFQDTQTETDVVPRSVDDGAATHLASAAAAVRLSVDRASGHCITPPHWQALIQRAIYAAGQ